MKSCKEDRLVLLLNGRLGGLAKWQTEHHVKTCSSCQNTLAELSALSHELLALSVEAPSEILFQRIPVNAPLSRSPHHLYRLIIPAIGMLLGFLFSLGQFLDLYPTTVTQHFAFQSREKPFERVEEIQRFVKIINNLSPSPQANGLSWGAPTPRSFASHLALRIQKRNNAQAKQELAAWVQRIQTSPEIKNSNCDFWAISPPLPFESYEPKKILTLLIGSLIGLFLGAILSLMVWLWRTIAFITALPLHGALLGMILVPILYQNFLQAGTGVGTGKYYGASATLELQPLHKSYPPLLPQEDAEKIISATAPELLAPLRWQMRCSLSEFRDFKEGAFKATLGSDNHLTAESAEHMLQAWKSTLEGNLFTKQTGWKVSVSKPIATENGAHSQSRFIWQPIPLGFLGGLVVGAILSLLIRLGNLLPGGMIGKIAICGTVGILISIVQVAQKPRYSSFGVIRIIPRHKQYIRHEIREKLANNAQPEPYDFASENSMNPDGGGTLFSLRATGKTPEQARKHIAVWIQQITNSNALQALDQKTVVITKATVQPDAPKEVWRAVLQAGLLGLAAGLFLALTRRR